jgi:AcrR family transcriptional regulator
MGRLNPKDGAKRAKAEMYQRLILEAAEGIFASAGFEDAKIQDIAQGAGISLGTLYTVFPGKSEIYEAIQAKRGPEILESMFRALQGHAGVYDACMRGIEAYVRFLVERPAYLRMHLREGLTWTERESLRSAEQRAIWERGVSIAVSLLQAGIEQGYFHGDNPPELLLKMMIASHQVQIKDWLDRGAVVAEVDALVARMQAHFSRAFVRAEHVPAAFGSRAEPPASTKTKKRVSG